MGAVRCAIDSAASTSAPAGQLIESLSSSAQAVVGGRRSTAEARGRDRWSVRSRFASGAQAIALETGAPDAASVASVLSINPNIDAAFGASPSFFAIGELGGAHSSQGGRSQTSTSEIDLTVDLTQLPVRQDLLVGLYDGVAVGSGFTKLTFDIYADGADVLHQAFSSVAAATAYFTDHAIDLGSLSSGPLSGDSLGLEGGDERHRIGRELGVRRGSDLRRSSGPARAAGRAAKVLLFSQSAAKPISLRPAGVGKTGEMAAYAPPPSQLIASPQA